MSDKQEWIFTFGAGQLLDGCFVAIEAENYNQARNIMMDHHGPVWAFQYDSREAAGVREHNLIEVPLALLRNQRIDSLAPDLQLRLLCNLLPMVNIEDYELHRLQSDFMRALVMTQLRRVGAA